jgi:hypothetical protein
MVPVVAAMVLPASVHAACDATSANAAFVASARDAIDDACPCAAAVSRREYRRCATDVVNARVGAGLLSRGCRREALKHAKLSICGWPGAAVCCRVRPDGRERHRVVSVATKCVNTHSLVACVSTAQSVPTGCDTTGCVPPPVCGNGVVEHGEDCDPPDFTVCSGECRFRCPPATSCGDGTLDPGEGCEPPGVGACGDDCQPVTCVPPAAGEVIVACDVAPGAVGAAASSNEYLVGWSDAAPGQSSAIVARRYDVDGAAIDPGRIVASADAPCGSLHDGPALASDGQDFYAIWHGLYPTPFNVSLLKILGRRIASDGTTAALDEHASLMPIGECQGFIDGPTMAAGVSPARFAVGWVEGAVCFFGARFQNPTGRFLDFNPGGTSQSVPLGFGVPTPPPATVSSSPASVASQSEDSLWVWNAIGATSPNPPYDYFIAAVPAAGPFVNPPVRLTSRTALTGGRPSVAAGATPGSFDWYLVAWSQGASDVATAVTEIRVGRVSFMSENDTFPDGGILLATSSTQITGGPVVAFDGNRWLVVWAEASGATNDLRAVALEIDGTVVDASPRLVASDVEAVEPAVASVGDGRVLVVFTRPNGTTRDVVGMLVTP